MEDPTNSNSLPTYRIFRDKHGIPQFEPKRGTQALKDALIYSFPTLETELQLMQAALRKFFDSERGSQFVYELPERDLQTSLALPKRNETQISPAQTAKASLSNWKDRRASLAQRTPSRASSRASSRSRAPSRASFRSETPIQVRETSVDVNGGGTMTTWMLSNGQELENRKRQRYDPVKRRKVAENRGNACEKHRASKTACDPNVCPQNKLYSKVMEDAQKESGGMSKATTARCGTEETAEQEIGDTAIASSRQAGPKEDADAPFEAETDVFWDAPQQDTTAAVSDDSLLSFGSINSLSTSWTDNSHAGPSPWSSWSSYAPTQNSTPGSNGFAQVIGIDEKTESHVFDETQAQVFGANQSTDLDQICDVSLLENHLETSIPPSLDSSGKPLQSSEDPFMGWATKRASHMFDDYGWVLSHVETL